MNGRYEKIQKDIEEKHNILKDNEMNGNFENEEI